MGRIALVLSGGGARGAYEAGVMHYIRTGLPKPLISKNFDIHCGTSAGAINSAALVAFAENPAQQADLKDIWLELKQDNVYRRDFSATTRFLTNTVAGVFRNITTFDPLGLGNKKGPHFNAFLDTAPLWDYLKSKVPWHQIEKNIHEGSVDALAIAATNTRSGRGELFLSKKNEIQYTGDYRVHDVEFQLEHIMASAAIPLVFPTVKVGKTYYTDGSLRLFTPMSPAIQLGADRIVITDLRHRATPEEIKNYDSQQMTKPPSFAELMGRLMNHIFLDRVQYDMDQLERINRVIEWSERVYGKNYLEKINKMLFENKIKGDVANRGLKKIRAVEISPSEFISEIFGRWFQKMSKKTFQFSPLEKLLLRVLDVDAPASVELLSYLIFAKEYIKDLIDLGYEDAKRQRHRLIEIMSAE